MGDLLNAVMHVARTRIMNKNDWNVSLVNDGLFEIIYNAGMTIDNYYNTHNRNIGKKW